MSNCPPNCALCSEEELLDNVDYQEPDDFSGASEGDR